MYTTTKARNGVALMMALNALVIIGVLVTGVVFVVTQDYRIAANTASYARAAAATELGLNRVLNEWNLADNARLKSGDTLQRVYATSGGGKATVLVTRLPGVFYSIVSEGQAGARGIQASARRRYGTLCRLDTPNIPFMGALTGRGNILVGGSALVSGRDVTPSGWSDCPAVSDVAGIVMSDTTAGLKLPGCSIDKHCVDGVPKFIQTPAAADTNTYFNYGNSTYQDLAAMANLTLAGGVTLTGIGPVVVGGQCAKSVTVNWGEPNRASPAGVCESYFPIIHVLGSVLIASNGRGQGILLVDGDLNVTGGFTFKGIIIVRGTLNSYGTGAKLTGGVLAADVSIDAQSDVLGNSTIQYSSCVVQTVLRASAFPKAVKQRGWVDLY